MVVHDNHGTGGGDDGKPEHFAGMHQNGVHRADGNKLVAFDALARVQKQNGKAFAIGVKVRMAGKPKIKGARRNTDGQMSDLHG